jgi:hypothetical protein
MRESESACALVSFAIFFFYPDKVAREHVGLFVSSVGCN